MNWKNPIRVFAVLGWLVVQGFVLLGWAGWRVFQGFMLLGWTVFRVVQFVVALPPLLLFFFGGLWYAVWSFVRRLDGDHHVDARGKLRRQDLARDRILAKIGWEVIRIPAWRCSWDVEAVIRDIRARLPSQ